MYRDSFSFAFVLFSDVANFNDKGHLNHRNSHYWFN